MEKVFVVKRVAEKLWATEEAIDGALVEASALLNELVAGRRELKVSTVTTDAATAKIAEAMKALAEARSSMTAAHNELNEIKLRLGVRIKMNFKPPLVAQKDEAAEVRDAV